LPWSIPYLLPAHKWFPIYWPNAEWEVVTIAPSWLNPPKPPDGAIIPWWKMPKDQWPIEAPWEPKWFGAWPASKVMMSEDLPPSIWPGGHRTPPFGFIKLKMPGEDDQKGYQIPFNHMRMHMRPEIGPIHHMKIMTRINSFGETKFYVIDKNWDQHEWDHKQYRAAMRARNRERVMEMLAAEIARTKGEPKPTVDLF
jgi:hypothetical protein